MEDVEVFLNQISKAYPSPDWQYWGRSLPYKRMIPSDSIPGRFNFMARSNTLNHQVTNHTSLLFFACHHLQCWTNTRYTTLTSRAIKKQLCGPVRFHYAYLLPYRWQYWYVTTVLPAFASNMFYVGWSVCIWLSLIFIVWAWQFYRLFKKTLTVINRDLLLMI